MKATAVLYVTLIMSGALPVAAQDAGGSETDAKTSEPVTAPAGRLTLDTTSVTANRELPTVLVIVPWKNPELTEVSGRPLASLVEEVLSPVDPDVFRRQVNYYNALNGTDADDAAATDQE